MSSRPTWKASFHDVDATARGGHLDRPGGIKLPVRHHCRPATTYLQLLEGSRLGRLPAVPGDGHRLTSARLQGAVTPASAVDPGVSPSLPDWQPAWLRGRGDLDRGDSRMIQATFPNTSPQQMAG